MKYKMVSLSDIADIITGFPFKSAKFNCNGDGIRLVRGKNITRSSLRWGSDTRYWNEISNQLEKYYLRENDIVIGMDGSLVGKNYAQIKQSDLPLLLVQRVACIRAKKGIDQNFLWDCISSERFEKYVDAVKTGSAIPHISGKQIGEFSVPNFEMDYQNKISGILSLLDNKIELNNAINNNLAA